MDTILDIFAPAIGTIAIIALCFMIGVPIHLFLEKTNMGARIKNATPFMGWYEEVDEDYTNFRIHGSNFIKVPSSH